MFRFTDPYKRSAEVLAKRIAMMLVGDERVERRPDGASWKWDCGMRNDYFLHEKPDGAFEFDWRYGNAEADVAYPFLFDRHLAVRVVEKEKA